MDIKTLEAIFEDFEDEFLEFHKVENKASNRPDLCAFIALDRLVPSEHGNDIVCAAEHDEIWLATDVEKLAAVATKEDILLLVRCGVRLDVDQDALAMFV